MNQKDVKQDISRLEILLKDRIGNEVRYRVEGESHYTNDNLKDYSVDGENITIVMEKESIITHGVNEVSFTEHEDRTDFWIYGTSKTNRFNVSVS